MYKAMSNTSTFVLVYLIFISPVYLADLGMIGLDSILYGLSMVVICSICFIRGGIIGKKWLPFIPVVAYALDLLPALSTISFTTYLYLALALIIGVACPVVALTRTEVWKTR